MIYVLRRVVAVATTHDNPTLEYQIIIRGFRNMNRLFTCSIHDGEHDGGDPCDLTVGGAENVLDFFEEDCDGFRESV